MTSDELKTWRRERSLTQHQLAHLLGVFPRTVSAWEQDTHAIPAYLHLALRGLEIDYKPIEMTHMSRDEFEALRQKLAVSQNKLAEMLGVTPGALSKWVRGHRKLPPFERSTIDSILAHA
jgi:DNA-binding transcriptional regulator YiaG